MKSCEILNLFNGISGLGMAFPVLDRKCHLKKLIFHEILRNIKFFQWHFRSGNGISGLGMAFPVWEWHFRSWTDRKCHLKKLIFRRISRNLNFFLFGNKSGLYRQGIFPSDGFPSGLCDFSNWSEISRVYIGNS